MSPESRPCGEIDGTCLALQLHQTLAELRNGDPWFSQEITSCRYHEKVAINAYLDIHRINRAQTSSPSHANSTNTATVPNTLPPLHNHHQDDHRQHHILILRTEVILRRIASLPDHQHHKYHQAHRSSKRYSVPPTSSIQSYQCCFAWIRCFLVISSPSVVVVLIHVLIATSSIIAKTTMLSLP